MSHKSLARAYSSRIKQARLSFSKVTHGLIKLTYCTDEIYPFVQFYDYISYGSGIISGTRILTKADNSNLDYSKLEKASVAIVVRDISSI